MKSSPSSPDFSWVFFPACQLLLQVIQGETRFVGGAVRNTLQGLCPEDIDLATVRSPEGVLEDLRHHGITALPTGLSHGTITAIIEGKPYEITTLRTDESTNGRHASVRHTSSWLLDAQRRDFTMNALYVDGSGQLYDPLGQGGIDDARHGYVRFIGNPQERLKEDYLRLLRFFRFCAFYGTTWHEESLKACIEAKDFLRVLSKERITKEILKLCASPHPWAVLQVMIQEGIFEVLFSPQHNNKTNNKNNPAKNPKENSNKNLQEDSKKDSEKDSRNSLQKGAQGSLQENWEEGLKSNTKENHGGGNFQPFTVQNLPELLSTFEAQGLHFSPSSCLFLEKNPYNKYCVPSFYSKDLLEQKDSLDFLPFVRLFLVFFWEYSQRNHRNKNFSFSLPPLSQSLFLFSRGGEKFWTFLQHYQEMFVKALKIFFTDNPFESQYFYQEDPKNSLKIFFQECSVFAYDKGIKETLWLLFLAYLMLPLSLLHGSSFEQQANSHLSAFLYFFQKSSWPMFPLKGQDLMNIYDLPPGPFVGHLLKTLRSLWVRHNFPSPEKLLSLYKEEEDSGKKYNFSFLK